MPLGPWTKSFAANKWAGYVFARHDLVPLINLASRNYLLQRYSIAFKDEYKYAYLKTEEVNKAKLYDEICG